MSADEFIYGVINGDTVGQLDLNVIANTLASADALIRQIKSQQEENGSLKEKIASLRSSALQIKQLYEAELGKNRSTADREQDYIRQLGELEGRTRDAENARVNAELREKETVAELERKLERSQQRYDGLAGDALRNAVLLAENGLLPADQQPRLRELKGHWQSQLNGGLSLPEDLVAILAKKKHSRKKSRKSDVESRDQATMTCGPTVTSTAVNTTATEVPALPPAKTFADKATMYSSSTVTRSTCTSAFIRRVDVGVNYPEVVPKSIDDILRECVVELPSLLSPILDDLPAATPPVQRESIETQTDPAPPSFTSVGTNTTLRNIRRKLDYVRKTENLAFTIKKEETISPASSIQNLPAAIAPPNPTDPVNPQLTQIWSLLGETMFRLLGNGRMFDSQQCFATINERLAAINSLIEPGETRARGTQMMSEALAVAAQAAMLGEARKQQQQSTVLTLPVEELRKGGEDYEEEASNEAWDDGVGEEEDVPLERSRTPEEPEQRLSTGVEEDDETGERQLEVEPVVSEFGCALEVTAPRESTTAMEVVDLQPVCEEEAEPTPAIAQPTTITAVQLEETKETCSTESPAVATPTPEPSIEPSSEVAAVTSSKPEVESVEQTTPIEDEPITQDSTPSDEPLPTEQSSPLDRSLPAAFSLSDLVGGVGEKHYLDVARVGEEHDDDDEESSDERTMMIVEGSPARTTPPSASSSCTSIGSNGTLISPIKVRETNELVKDQFKTPTSPAISKRKLRDARGKGGNPRKRGRLSPETESLLEDDWDRKFSRIKDYFALPSSLNPIESGAMWDDEEEEEEEEEVAEFKMPLEPLAQAAVKEEKKVEPVAELPVEEPKPSTSTAPWDDFKVPLRIEVPEIATTDSPESPPLEDSPMSPDDSPMSPQEAFSADDSPMSPIPEEEVEEDEEAVPLSCDDSPMSPPPDCRGSMYCDGVEPKVIPTDNPLASRLSQDYDNTPIGKTIARYNNCRRAEVLRNMAPELASKEAGLVRRIVTLVQKYVAAEWTAENLQRGCTEILAVTDNTKLISWAVMECAVTYQDFVLDVQCSPPAPPLPKSVQQLVLLVKTLNETLFTLDKVLLHELDRRVFTLKAGADKVMLESIMAMTYLYIGISDSSRLYGCTARLYIYKCLYYFTFKGLPLIYLVLKAFPHALPKKGSSYYDNSDAMVSTLRTVLMNINFMERSNAPDAHLYKKNELMKLFRFFYGYEPGKPTYDELITNLVEKIKANKLKNVDYCLILVAKRKGYEWSKDAIVQKHLYPLLNDYLKQLDRDPALDDRICCLIFTISAILKTQPNFQDVSRFMQMFGNIVQLADGNQRIQEAAVAGLVRFTRFGFADIYEWLCRWCPSYEVSGRTKLMLATFVHRKEVRFWQQLNQREIV